MNPEPGTYEPRRVDLTRIDVEDETFRITTGKSIDDLVDSIKCLGLLNLPVLLEKEAGYTIISGFRRVQACRRLNWRQFGARVLPPDTDRFGCVTVAIADNAFQRPLDIIEKSRCFNMLSGFYKDAESMAEALPKLGFSEHPAMIKKIETVYHMPEPVQSGILSNTIALSTALEIVGLSKADTRALIRLFDALSVSLNKQREILTMLKEIAIREDKPITQVLDTPHLKNIIEDKDPDKNRKARNIRTYLKQRRFPAVTAAEQSFRQHLKKLDPGKGMELIPPANFEGSTFTLKLTFNHLNELKDLKNALEIFTENPHLKQIVGE